MFNFSNNRTAARQSINRLIEKSKNARMAFTLIELMLVMAIMGLLGTISIGGFRAMRRGMEERRVGDIVTHFVENAYQRAKIDRQPVAVYYWNETRRSADSDEGMLVVGRAVAVRRAGRISARISAKGGDYLVDEFGDLKAVAGKDKDGDDDDGEEAREGTVMYLYKMDGNKGGFKRSMVGQATANMANVNGAQIISLMLTDKGWEETHKEEDAEVATYGYYLADSGGITWEVGDAYGFEFAEITLPNNYIFGSDFNDDTKDPIKDAGNPLYIRSDSSSVSKPPLSALRPGDDGKPTAKQIKY